MSEWKDIETAPKDGTEILVVGRSSLKPMYVAYWLDETGWTIWADMAGYRRCDPTHWMPLPPPPKA